MINNYKEVKECIYRNERYSVRDNGAIMRHPRDGKRHRWGDGVWTFGLKNSRSGYMMLGQHRVHIIVATAFLGAHDSNIYVVDHIDTNRCNNRVENLRWFTRLENILNNEITRNKIAYICGSIEAFIENPKILQERTLDKSSFEWMRSVTQEEAATAFENIKQYWSEQAASPQPLNGGKINNSVYRKQLSVTQYIPILSNEDKASSTIDSNFEQKNETEIRHLKSDLIEAKLPKAAWQKNWEIPAQFPYCPTEIENNSLQDYYNQLSIDEYYSITMFSEFDLIIERTVNKAYTKNNSAIIVLSKADEYLRLSKIYLLDEKFVHEHIQKYESGQDNQAFKHFISELGVTIEEYKKKEKFAETNLVKAKSPETAWQIYWKTPTDFLCCPETIGDNPIEEYYNRIVIGEDYNSTIFYDIPSTQKVIDKALTKENTIIVLSCTQDKSSIKPYALAKIHFFEGKYIHESISTFFSEEGGRKYFTSEQGLEWTEGDVFDDFC